MLTPNRLFATGFVVCAGLYGAAVADHAVVPSSGNGVELAGNNQGTIGGNTARRFMMVIDAQALTGIPIGSTLTGYRVRQNNANIAAWPPSPVTISDYEVRIGAAATTAATISATYADNISGVQTLVMDGPFSIATGSYGAAAAGSTPEEFGPVIGFDQGFLYLGGPLCIDINYSGTGLTSAVFMDGPGVGEGVASCYAVSRTATTGGVGNGNVLRFEYTPPMNSIVPVSLTSTEGPSGQEGPLGGTGVRRFQYNVDEAALGIPAGATILGMTFRLDAANGSTAWPAADVTFSDYEIRLSQGVSTGAMSTTYADNIVGSQTLVVNGARTLNTGAFAAENATPTPEQYGTAIMFQTPYLYLGGDLCVDINHPGTGAAPTGFLDGTLNNDYPTTGVRGVYSNVSRTAATGSLTNAPVTRFIYAADLRRGVTKVYAPDDNASDEGGSNLNSLVRDTSRSVMIVAAADQFDTIAPGSRVVGHAARLDVISSTWPGAAAAYSDYRIDVSRSVNGPGALSTTFAANVGTDVVTAYSGALIIPANALKGGGSNNPFSYVFRYRNPYTYTGGPLNTYVRHTGNGVTFAQLDSVLASAKVDSLLATDNTSATGSSASATVLRHEVDAATTVPLGLGDSGGSNLAGLLRFDEYSYQVVIGGDQLRYIPPGSLIDSMWLRNASFAPSSPASDSICPDFELVVSTAATSPGTMSTTFANNEGGDAVMVYDGPLGVEAGALPAGSTNAFGRVVKFQKAFVYKGGNLCVTLRHQKFTVDAGRCEAVFSTLPGARSIFAGTFDAASGSYLGGPTGGTIAGARFGYVPSVMTPNSFATVEADNGFDFLSKAGTMQMIVPASQLLPIDVGSAITGMSLRNSATGFAPTNPEAALPVGRLDVTLAPAARTPLTMSDTFAVNNGPGVVKVREGATVIPAGAFPASGNTLIPGENEWFIEFERAFIYPGGDLCVTIRTTATLPAFSYLDTGLSPSVLGAGRWNSTDPDALTSTAPTGPVAMRFAFTARAFCPWDLNNDGFVDDADFPIFLNAYNILDCADGSMPFGCPADFNHDGVVEDTDFQAFVVAYNELLCP